MVEFTGAVSGRSSGHRKDASEGSGMKKDQGAKKPVLNLYIPDTPCMAYLPTLTPKTTPM